MAGARVSGTERARVREEKREVAVDS
jgi:hypothetical protein